VIRTASATLRRFWRCHDGSNAVENAILASLIALAAILATEFLAKDVFDNFVRNPGTAPISGHFPAR
jgi:Flp pilus assembly pilin Flp